MTLFFFAFLIIGKVKPPPSRSNTRVMYKVDYQNKTDQNKSRLEILAIIEALGETREIFNVLQV